ncbi:hypothetical protein DFH06DRAFT_1343328 [Mycena polygramma]|nr:hypothetical protein DFH06DRAFT_1343328 [Mycena polygramma]
MHPCLLRSNMSQLPQPQRTFASKAATGSVTHLLALDTYTRKPNVARNTLAGLLPVVYPNLDPAGIPDSVQLDTMLLEGTMWPSIDCAVLALSILASISELGELPIDVAPDLWPIVWKWMNFLHTYLDFLPHKIDHDLRMIQDGVIVRTFANHTQTAELIYSTVGTRSLLAKAWKVQVADKSHSGKDETIFRGAALSLEVLTIRMDGAANTEEVFDALGGIGNMAATLVAHIAKGAAIHKTPLSLESLAIALLFIKERALNDELLNRALFSKGIVTALLAAIRSLKDARSTDVWTNPNIRLCFDALQLYASMPPGYPWVIEALGAGLLDMIIVFAPRSPGSDDAQHFYQFFGWLLQTIIPSALVYHRAVVQIRRSLNEAVVTPAFKKSRTYTQWEGFCTVVQRPISILHKWERRSCFRACDNMQCCKIGKKDQLMECAACQSTNYCSKECQVSDWKNGHRKECEELCVARCRNPEPLSGRELSFMRAVLHHDFEQMIFDASRQQAEFMKNSPGEQCITILDYTDPRGVTIKVHHPAKLPAMTPRLQVEVRAQLARAARSNGQLQLHMMYVTEGPQRTRLHLFPQRAATGTFHKDLQCLARDIPAGHDFTADSSYLRPRLFVLTQKRNTEFPGIH